VLEHGLRAQSGPGFVSDEKSLEFVDHLFGGSFRDQVSLDLELERLLEVRGSVAEHSSVT